MGITAQLAKLSALFFDLPDSDGKFYAIKDKAFAEVTSGGGGSLFTKANWRQWVYTGVYSSRGGRGHFNREGIGFSLGMTDRIFGVAGPYAAFRQDDFQITGTGTGAGAQLPIAANAGYGLTTGTTATGSSTMFNIPVIFSKLADGTSYTWNEISEVWYTGRTVIPAALSTATQRYTVDITLQVATITQARFRYLDTLNSGKWQFTYTNAANAQVNVDTGITVAAATGYTPIIQLVWNTGTSQFDLTVSLGAFSATYTDLRINTQLATNVQAGLPSVTNKIEKSVGTTASIAFVTSSFIAVSLK